MIINIYGLRKVNILNKIKLLNDPYSSQSYLVYKESIEVLTTFSHDEYQLRLKNLLTEPSKSFLFKLRYLIRHKYINKFLLNNYKGLLLLLFRKNLES